MKGHGQSCPVAKAADLEAFVRVWLGYRGLTEALASGDIAFSGPARQVAELKRILRIPDTAGFKQLSSSAAA